MPRLGIHTIFRARENVLFLREWIEHHAALGVERFLLYDNSRSVGTPWSTSTVNKYDVPFAELTAGTSDAEIAAELSALASDFAGLCSFRPWEPRDERGRITYQQVRGMLDALERVGSEVDWLGFFDVDEFLFSPSGEALSNLVDEHADGAGLTVLQKKFEDRFANLGRPVRSIRNCVEGYDTSRWAPKMFVRPDKVKRAELEVVHRIPVNGTIHRVDPRRLRFNHYNVNPKLIAWARSFYEDPAFDLNAEDGSLAEVRGTSPRASGDELG